MNKKFRKNMIAVLVFTALSSNSIILYSSEIKTVIIRNNRVKISLDKAKKIAFEHSRVHSNSAKLTRLILEKENKKYIYEIVFYYKNKKYRYNVDANTGRILSYSSHDNIVSSNKRRDSFISNIPVPAAPSMQTSTEEKDNVVASNSDKSLSDESKAKENLSEVNSIKEDFDQLSRQNGYAKSTEVDKDVETIILEQLKQNVFENLEGAVFEEIILVNANKSVYKGTVKVGYLEYKFKINLFTGEILNWKEIK